MIMQILKRDSPVVKCRYRDVRYVKYRDMGDTRTLMIIAKVRGKCY